MAVSLRICKAEFRGRSTGSDGLVRWLETQNDRKFGIAHRSSLLLVESHSFTRACIVSVACIQRRDLRFARGKYDPRDRPIGFR